MYYRGVRNKSVSLRQSYPIFIMSNEHTFPTGDQAIVAHNMVKVLENERKRISFVLHDTIQHQFRIIKDEALPNIVTKKVIKILPNAQNLHT